MLNLNVKSCDKNISDDLGALTPFLKFGDFVASPNQFSSEHPEVEKKGLKGFLKRW